MCTFYFFTINSTNVDQFFFRAKGGIAMVSCPSVCPSVFNVEVSWSHRLEFLENNFTAD